MRRSTRAHSVAYSSRQVFAATGKLHICGNLRARPVRSRSMRGCAGDWPDPGHRQRAHEPAAPAAIAGARTCIVKRPPRAGAEQLQDGAPLRTRLSVQFSIAIDTRQPQARDAVCWVIARAHRRNHFHIPRRPGPVVLSHLPLPVPHLPRVSSALESYLPILNSPFMGGTCARGCGSPAVVAHRELTRGRGAGGP